MRKRGILIIGVALMIAAAGVVYAHWTETLYVNATVNTGEIQVHWKDVWTNDDGDPDGMEVADVTCIWPSGCEIGDPAGRGYAAAAPRYDKDVAECIASISADGYTYTLTVSNAYPSYYCTAWSEFGNQGTVPVKLQSIAVTTNLTVLPDGSFLEGEKWTENGTLCGLQIDPEGIEQTANTLHIKQAALQNAAYTFSEVHTFVNWNEWEESDCVMTLNGTPIPWGIEP